MNALEIHGLSKKRKDFQLDQIHLTLPMGYILGYVGENGAGKTTTIKCILNLLKPDSGSIKVSGLSYEEDSITYLDQIGYISDDCLIPGQFKMSDIIKTMKDFYPSFDTKKFSTYCDLWKLPTNKKVSDFSKGMQVRLMFAVIMSRNTKLLVLDEATSGLDPVVRSEILEFLQDYIEDGKHSVLFSTHIMSDLEQIADFICFIDQGKQIFFDTVDNIKDQYCLVKGTSSQFDTTLENSLIGAKITNTGLEGLIAKKSLPQLKHKLLEETPSIEQIIVYHIKGIRRR